MWRLVHADTHNNNKHAGAHVERVAWPVYFNGETSNTQGPRADNEARGVSSEVVLLDWTDRRLRERTKRHVC